MDIVAFYIDLGRPYAAQMERLCGSIRRNVRGGRSILLTPTPKAEGCRHFDEVIEVGVEADEKTLMLQRARANCSFQRSSSATTLYCDPDVEFLATPSGPVFEGEADIALLWRDRPGQRVNTACFLSRPGQAGFWQRYAAIVANMPPETHAWWSDQMAFTLMLGHYHAAGDILPDCDGSRVHLMAPSQTCSLPEEEGNPWALHYRGPRKGAGWEQYYRQPKVAGLKAAAGRA